MRQVRRSIAFQTGRAIRSSILGILAVLCVAFPSIPTSAFAASARDFSNCSQSRDIERSVAGCKQVLKDRRVPKNLRAIARNNIGTGYIAWGEYAKAIDECTEAIALDPTLVGPYLCVGVAHRWRGEFDQAVAIFDAGLAKQPKSGHLHMGRAMALFEQHDYEAALKDADQSVRLEPRLGDAYMTKALIVSKLESLDAAIAVATDGIRAEPKYPPCYVTRGDLWRQKGDLDRALADQTKAVELGPNDAENFIGRGTVERYRGDYASALADFGQALRIVPEHPAALAGRGLTFEKMGDLAKARQDYEQTISSLSQVRTGGAKDAIEMAKSRLAAFDSGAPQPTIPPAPRKAMAPTSVPAPVAQVPTVTRPTSSEGRRVALVIGNSSYETVPKLVNPSHDAEAIAKSLRAVGFDNVDLVIDATHDRLIDALHHFDKEAENSAWAMIYYAGHGMEVNGTNYLIPVDAKLRTDQDIDRQAVALNQAMIPLERATKLKLVVLDACRNNPFSLQQKTITSPALSTPTPVASRRGSRAIGRGLAEIKVGSGTLVVYSAKHGELALDGDGANSPFAVAMVQRIATPHVEINKLFRLIRDDVMETTAGRQEPFTYGSLPGKEDFYFLDK